MSGADISKMFGVSPGDKIVGLSPRLSRDPIAECSESCANLADAWEEFDPTPEGQLAARNIAALIRHMNGVAPDPELRAAEIVRTAKGLRKRD